MSRQSTSHIIEVRTLLEENSLKTSKVTNESDYLQRRKELGLRTTNITNTLQQLTKQQVSSYRFRHIMQIIIVIFFMAIVATLTVAIIICINYILKNEDISITNEIVVLVGSCVTYLTSVISIVTIIVKYLFPENEDKLLAEIVPKILEEEKILFQSDINSLNNGQDNDG